MNRLHPVLICIIAVLISISSCREEDSRLGHGLVESSFRNIVVDSCIVDISTVYLDSMATQGDSICQIGYYSDNTWGRIKSMYYCEFSTNTIKVNDDNSYAFDSLTLVMKHSGHYWGDTIQPQAISIYRLKNPIDVPEGQTLNNKSSFSLEESPSYTFRYSPRPQKNKEQIIRLPDEWGRKLLNDLLAETDYFESQEKFRLQNPGIALVPEGGTYIGGFIVNDSSMCINLHYHEISNVKDEQTIRFKVNNECAFTRVEHDRKGTPLENLKSGVENAIHYHSSGNQAFMQGLTGIYNQIEFPTLSYLEAEGDIVSVESATLLLYPIPGSYIRSNLLPKELRLFITDDNNVLEDYVYGSDGNTVQTGNLIVDEQFGKDTYYTFDLTEFCRKNLGRWGMYRQRLLLTMMDEDVATTFNQVIFSNDLSEDNHCKLILRLKIYDN